ncbi:MULTISPECIES: tRNA pseudouridine synthase A [Desulfobacula]|uniref:tRNA pseudouridine synthase A n=2 Tax=Desulfobacula TaxID=28222 RepID=K0NCV3_DESTT|nr:MULTISPECIES: tRNA pseudouridine synthase A [Desulfobacula]CCK78530.1 TruA: tRNA pseudouridine synthase I [Desulfobacula toluolica Tol2]SDU52352.1 tRNA pseudouridine38-40 synthase [Desulfobacula phenolica]
MKKFYYLIHIQYMGYRYHGWLKQPGLKTIEFMIEKTTKFILGHTDFKILGTSRTDAKVSANHSAFELFVNDPLDTNQLFMDFNQNLPNDIKVIKIEEKDKNFNIINAPRIKEYLYLFSFGEKSHPFSAPLISSFQYDLDLDLMKKGALLFKGKHNFIKYCTKPKPGTKFKREILVSKIKKNTIFKANFFPDKTYAYHIHSAGFLRYQVRLIMGQLLSLGRGEIRLGDIKESLEGKDNRPLRHIAPSSGLVLHKINFDS